MPAEIASLDQFKELLKNATEIRIVRNDDSAKVKLRTSKGLFTFKTSSDEVDSVTKGTKVPIVEF